jgi:hypothetical protein
MSYRDDPLGVGWSDVYEEDESVSDVTAAFEAGEQGVTKRAGGQELVPASRDVVEDSTGMCMRYDHCFWTGKTSLVHVHKRANGHTH